MIYPETGWFEIVQYNDKYSDTIANMIDPMWLCRYPCPTKIMYDCGNKFLGHAFINDLIKNKYGIKSKCATTATTQAN